VIQIDHVLKLGGLTRQVTARVENAHCLQQWGRREFD